MNDKGSKVKIRHSTLQDIDILLSIFASAKDYMIKSGNPNQWKAGYPSIDIIEKDIDDKNSYIVEENDKAVGTFTFIQGEDPTYISIRGKWLNNLPYGTIHRLASNGGGNGLLHKALDYCTKINPNIKIDTHKDNKIMQLLLCKEGFTECGIITGVDGDDRIAYQKYYF